jgi:hypothetical protein
MNRKDAKALADLARRLHNPTGPEVPFQALQDMEAAARFIDSALADLKAPRPRLSEKDKAAASFFAARAPASVLKGGKA